MIGTVKIKIAFVGYGVKLRATAKIVNKIPTTVKIDNFVVLFDGKVLITVKM